jgi:hypothetical protein
VSDDLDLFTSGQAWARSSDPSTAHEAANEQRGSKAARLSALVIRALTVRGPSTSKEVADWLGMMDQFVSISPRFRPLANAEKIEEYGKRNGAIVWRIKPSTAMERAG